MANVGPAVIITNVFQEPITDKDIRVSVDLSRYGGLRQIIDDLKKIENEHREYLDLLPVDEMPAILIPSTERLELQQYIKTDERWKRLFVDAVMNSGIEPDCSLEQQITAINLPDWNELTARLIDLSFNEGKLFFEFDIAHTYATQLNRRGLLQEGSFKPISVYGNIRTKDDETMMGIRGGHFLVDGHMPIPAGSLYLTYDENGKPIVDPFAAFRKEFEDESGQHPENENKRYWIEGIIGSFVERTSCSTHGLVYLVRTDQSESELWMEWDKKGDMEHNSLFFKSQKEMPGYIASKSDLRKGIVSTVDLKRPLLASGAATLLVQLARTAKEDFERTLNNLGGVYGVVKNYSAQSD